MKWTGGFPGANEKCFWTEDKLMSEKDELDELLKRKEDLECMAQAHAVAGQPLPEDVTREYMQIEARIKALMEKRERS